MMTPQQQYDELIRLRGIPIPIPCPEYDKWKKYMDDTLGQMISNIVQKQYEESKQEQSMKEYSIREKVPQPDEECFVRYEDLQIKTGWHRAYFEGGHFYTLEDHHAFPLLVSHWISAPKIEGKE